MENYKEMQANEQQMQKNVYWKVIDEIIGGIRAHEYQIGDRIPAEPELMKMSGLSRGSVREAIKVLSALGIVTIQRGEGTFISDAQGLQPLSAVTYTLLMSQTTPQQLVEFRRSIDELVLRIVIEKITEEELALLEENICRMQRAYEDGDWTRVWDMDVQFHMYLVDFMHNPFFSRMMAGLYEFFIPEFIKRNPNRGPFFESSLRSHQRTVKLLRDKDYVLLNSEEVRRQSEIFLQYPDVADKTKTELLKV